MRIVDTIEVRTNLIITARERGKIIERREGHNIWLDLGKEYLAQLIAYDAFGPDTPRRNDRIKYFGVGIGGTTQNSPKAATTPISPPYVGTNVQDDTTPTVSTLERPVRISGSTSAYPGIAGDAWIGQVAAPADLSIPREVTFSRVFIEEEVSYTPYLSVPLTEIMMFTSAADPENYQNVGVAYDTFDPLHKTSGVAIEFVWTIRFG